MDCYLQTIGRRVVADQKQSAIKWFILTIPSTTRSRLAKTVDPPVTYLSGQLKWEHHDSWQGALATALTKKGCTYAGKEMTGDEVQTIFANTEDSPAYAQTWNKATNTMIQYQLDQTDEKWTAMERALEIAGRPFWS
jgi:hypothetical protein